MPPVFFFFFQYQVIFQSITCHQLSPKLEKAIHLFFKSNAFQSTEQTKDEGYNYLYFISCYRKLQVRTMAGRRSVEIVEESTSSVLDVTCRTFEKTRLTLRRENRYRQLRLHGVSAREREPAWCLCLSYDMYHGIAWLFHFMMH